ncbi:MAG: IclR family transcriptional regulator, partial [Chthoniobacterales bacterium]|nr:IclR family transcriptional regulator [Chthoniobacterales bacterium]
QVIGLQRMAADRARQIQRLDAALPGMGGIGVPIRDDAGQVIAALSVGASSDRIRRRETELAEMLKKEAMILMRAMAQPAKPGALKMIKVS